MHHRKRHPMRQCLRKDILVWTEPMCIGYTLRYVLRVVKRTRFVGWLPTSKVLLYMALLLPGTFAEAAVTTPAFQTLPPTTAKEKQLYKYQIEVLTNPFRRVGLTLKSGPTGMNLSTPFRKACSHVRCIWQATLQWLPQTNSANRSYSIVIEALESPGGAGIQQKYTLFVQNTNDPPLFSSRPPTTGKEDTLYSHQLKASDPDPTKDTITYTLRSGPRGMSLHASTGLLTWKPTNAQVGKHPITLRITDNHGAFTEWSYVLIIQNVNDPPAITSTPPKGAVAGQLYNYIIQANDPDPTGDTITYHVKVAPKTATIDAKTGLLQWTPQRLDTNKTFSFTIEAKDNKGLQATQSWQVKVVASNRPPKFLSLPKTVAYEDAQYSYDIALNDPDNDPVKLTLLQAPKGMVLSPVSGLNKFRITWRPTNQHVGVQWITLQADDLNGGLQTQRYPLFVKNTNDPPVFISKPQTTAVEDQNYRYQLKALDPDPTNDRLYFSFIQQPTGMRLDATTGVIQWKPTNQQAAQSFLIIVKVDDRKGGSSQQKFTLQVQNINDPPKILSKPKATAIEDQLYTYAIKADDLDPTKDTLTYRFVSGPQGMALNAKTGVLSWTPSNEDAQQKNHSVHIEVSDGQGGKAQQLFTLSVQNTNDPPVFTSTPILGASVGRLYRYPAQAKDPDPTGDSISFRLEKGPTGMKVDIKTGIVSWQPQNTHAGKSYPVIIQAIDNYRAIARQSYTLKVILSNRSPKLISTAITSIQQNQHYNYQVKATDPDGDSLQFVLEKSPQGMQIQASSGLVTWQPLNKDVGKHEIKIRIDDRKGGTAYQYFILVVQNVNDPPFILSPPPLQATEERLYSYQIKASDPDPTQDVLTYSQRPAISGLVLNAKTGLLTWKPTNAQVGQHTILLEVSDNKGGKSTQRFTLTVQNVNDPPYFLSKPVVKLTEDVVYHYQVKAKDPDPTKDVLSYTLLQKPGGMSIDLRTGLLTWKPTNDNVGKYQVEIRIEDNKGGFATQLFQLEVHNVNDPPAISSRPPTGATQKKLYTYQIKAMDPDPTKDTLTYRLSKAPAGMKLDAKTGAITWTPTQKEVGKKHLVVVTVQDNYGAFCNQSWEISVFNINDPPTLQSKPSKQLAIEDQLFRYQLKAIDNDKDPLIFRLTRGPKGMQLSPSTGLLEWTPTNADVGTHTLSIQVDDNKGGVTSYTWSLQVQNTNDPPKITSVPPSTILEDKTFRYQIVAKDPDPTRDTLSYKLLTFPKGMTLNAKTGMLSWIPENQHAQLSHTVEVQVSDNKQGKDSQRFSLKVLDQNDPPVFSSKPPEFATEDKQYLYLLQAKDPDPTKDQLQYQLLQSPKGMTLDSNGGLLRWTPTNQDANQQHTISIQVSDGRGGHGKQNYKLFVYNQNDPPKITSTPVLTGQLGQLYTYQVQAKDPDPTKDTLSYELLANPKGMQIDRNKGLIRWTATSIDVGKHTITIRASDGKGGSDEQTYTLTLKADPQSPIAQAGPAQYQPPGEVSLDGSRSKDPNGNALSYTWTYVQGPSPKTKIEAAHTAKPKLLLRRNGIHVLQLVVSSQTRKSPPSRVEIHIQNLPPFAYAGPTKVVYVGQQFQLDGSQSDDSNGDKDKLRFSWKQASGLPTTLSDSASPRPSLNLQRAGIYQFELTVSDGERSSAPSTVQIIVLDPGKKQFPPQALISSPKVGSTGQKMELDGSRSRFFSSKQTTFIWKQLEGPEFGILRETNKAKVQWIPKKAGSYLFQLQVQNDVSISPPAFIRVEIHAKTNKRPEAKLELYQVALFESLHTLNASGSKVHGSHQSIYRWKQTFGPAVTLKNAETATPSFLVLNLGIYRFQLIIQQKDGEQSPPVQIWIEVNRKGNKIPIPWIGEDLRGNKAVKAGESVSLNGSSSYDPEGQAITYHWKQVLGPPVVLENSTTSAPAFTPYAYGILGFQLAVSDGTTRSALSRIMYIVVHSEENHVPIANAGEDRKIYTGIQLILDGSKSKDADQDTLKYDWRLLSSNITSIALQKADTIRPTVNIPKDTTINKLVFGLVVDDGKIRSLEDTMTISIIGVNQAPKARLQAPTQGKTQQPVNLDGSGSSDPNEGDILSFSWKQLSGPKVALQSDNQAKTYFVASESGKVTFRLTVSDGTLSDSTDITIQITPKETKPPEETGCNCSSTPTTPSPYAPLLLLLYVCLPLKQKRRLLKHKK